MKKLLALGLACAFFSIAAQGATDQIIRTELLKSASLIALSAPPQNIFGWHVGDTLNFNMRIKPIPVIANAKIYFAGASAEGMTLIQETSYKTLKVVTEILMDNDTGQVKQIKVNGKVQKTPQGKASAGTKIIKEEEVRGFKVAAGTFDAIHMVTEDSQGNQTEAWVNPRDIPLSGLLKSSSVQGDVVTVEMELASFVRGQ